MDDSDVENEAIERVIQLLQDAIDMAVILDLDIVHSSTYPDTTVTDTSDFRITAKE